MKWPVFVCLLLIVNQSQAAPKNAAMDRLDLANDEPIGNPLHFGQDELKYRLNASEKQLHLTAADSI